MTAGFKNKGQQSPNYTRPQDPHTTDLTSRDDSFLLSRLLGFLYILLSPEGNMLTLRVEN